MVAAMGDLSKPAIGEPEWRGALLAEVIRHTAHVAGPICLNGLFRHLLDWLGLPEEECGAEIYSTVFCLVRTGLYTSNTYDAATGELWLGHDTQLTPARTVTLYLYGDTEGEPEEAET